MNNVSCADHLSYVQNVTNAPIVAIDLFVGARLHQFWEKCIPQGRIHSPLPVLAKSDKVIHYHKLLCLSSQESLPVGVIISTYEQQSELATTSPGFYNRLFLVPKPNNRWRPILDLSILNKFLKTESFKVETTEMIKTSYRQGSGLSP